MDKKRVLSKIDELNGYLQELEKVKPITFKEYESSIEKKRSSERLLQISIESVLDVCNIIFSDLKLGLPSNEEDVFKKLQEREIISRKMVGILSSMKKFRNIIVHKYGVVNDELVFEMLSKRLKDFDKFKKEILNWLN